MTYTQGFSEIRTDDIALAGGKGANLGELARAGFPVPPGFVVTTEAYRSLIDDPAIRAVIDDLEALDSGSAEELMAAAGRVRSLVREREFGEAVAASVTDAFGADVDADTTHAVRSSATAEDLPTASFAGQHDSYLGVPEADVLGHVRDCMASLFTDRAVAYHARNDVSHPDVAMTVVVQEVVDANAAGVLFTADADTNDRTVASIDATYGLGDTVVPDEVSADNARIEKETGEVLAYEVGEKRVELMLERTGGTRTADTTSSRRETRVLSDTGLQSLVSLGNRIEALFGTPQDIEWTLVESEASADASNGTAEPRSGEFVILQSRPITSLIAPPEPRLDDRLHVYMSIGHGQAMTDPMPPLALDLWERVYDDSMNEMLNTEGTWMTRTEGRSYVDITPFLGFGVARRGVARALDSISEPTAEGAAQLFDERRAEFDSNRSLRCRRSPVRW
jgi:pyruvate,water dikinase